MHWCSYHCGCKTVCQIYFQFIIMAEIGAVKKKASRLILCLEYTCPQSWLWCMSTSFFSILVGHCTGRCISAFGANRYIKGQFSLHKTRIRHVTRRATGPKQTQCINAVKWCTTSPLCMLNGRREPCFIKNLLMCYNWRMYDHCALIHGKYTGPKLNGRGFIQAITMHIWNTLLDYARLFGSK